MCLCPKDTNLLAYFDEVLLFCVEQTIATFINAVWMDTRVIWNLKKYRKSSLLPTSNGQIWTISVRYMRKQIYYQNRSIMSQKHLFKNKSWPLDDFDLWPFDLFSI